MGVAAADGRGIAGIRLTILSFTDLCAEIHAFTLSKDVALTTLL